MAKDLRIKIGNWKLPAHFRLSEAMAGGGIGNWRFSKLKRQGGFVLLFTVLISSVILLLTLGISQIAYRETILTSEARGAADAFFAADTGIECGLYLALGGGTLCSFGPTKTITDAGITVLNFNPAGVDLDGKCIMINHQPESKVIESRGHNLNCNEVRNNNPRAVQRAIRVTY